MKNFKSYLYVSPVAKLSNLFIVQSYVWYVIMHDYVYTGSMSIKDHKQYASSGLLNYERKDK